MNTLAATLAIGVNLAAPSILIGFLIGFGGIGGVLLAPALNIFGGVPIHEAIRICMWVYVLSGVVGTAVFLRNNYICTRSLWTLSLGACPGALVGSLSLSLVSAQQLEILIALIILFSGVHALRSINLSDRSRLEVPRGLLIVIGLITGFGSAITGTGGPLILIPILLVFRVQVKQTVGLAQSIQIPIALVASVGNLISSAFDVAFASLIAGVVALGVLVGASMAHRSSSSQLKKGLGAALVVIAIIYGLHGVDKLMAAT
jgi:hypothetical protein